MKVRATYGIHGILESQALDELLAAVGLEVVEGWPFNGRVREVYAAGMLGIRAGLSPGWVRWLKCHGLGHHLLHRGNHLFADGGLCRWESQEIEAELFAGLLLVPDAPRWVLNVAGFATLARVPRACATAWQAAFLTARPDGGPRGYEGDSRLLGRD